MLQKTMREVKLIPFTEATTEDIKKIANAYYNNEITLNEITTAWKVGDIGYHMNNPMKIVGINEEILDTPRNGHNRALLTMRPANIRVPMKSLPRMSNSYLKMKAMRNSK